MCLLKIIPKPVKRRNIGSNRPPLRFASCSSVITAISKQCEAKHYFMVGRISGEDFMAASCPQLPVYPAGIERGYACLTVGLYRIKN